MTILITGATGNVGRVLAGQLAEAGESVRGLTRNPAKADLPPGVEA
ncbi:MAG: NAD-dependent epimerase/dehydratase family protein, partial [Stackebrandtia sp.]